MSAPAALKKKKQKKKKQSSVCCKPPLHKRSKGKHTHGRSLVSLHTNLYGSCPQPKVSCCAHQGYPHCRVRMMEKRSSNDLLLEKKKKQQPICHSRQTICLEVQVQGLRSNRNIRIGWIATAAETEPSIRPRCWRIN